MRIVTISREFGSGGRELGKRLADLLGCDYYDKQIISAIAQKQGMDEGYVEKMLENHGWREVPLHFRSSFAAAGVMWAPQTELWLAQKSVVESIAKAGKDCVIIGRNADVLLREYGPLNLFVCADMAAKAARCVERAGPEEEGMSRRELERWIRDVDKGRAQLRGIITASRWGERSAYHLTVNTSGWDLRELAPAVEQFARRWFERSGT